MIKALKPSMFNYLCEDEQQLILYNSFNGTRSISKVSEYNKEEVRKLLSQSLIENSSFNNLTDTLFELGFLVHADENEKVKREFLFSQFVNDDTLDLVITLTEKCNFTCKYCAQDFAKGKMSETVQTDIVQFVKKNINKYGKLRVEWFGGEPLLCIDIIKKLSESFIDICRKSRKGYSAAITTNGYLLDIDTFRMLYNNKVIAYQITLDGLKKSHDEQRCLSNQKGTYDRIMSNLMDIKNNTSSAIFRINIRTNFTKSIVDDIENYLSFYAEKFAGDNRFVFLARAAEDWGGERVKDFEGLLDKNECNILMEKIYNRNPKIDFYSNYSFLEPASTVCHAVHKNMFNIGCDGKIYKCDSSIDIACIGEIGAGGKMNINDYKMALWSCGTRYTSLECEECFFSCSCIKGGCPLDIIKGYDPKQNRCSFEKNNIDSLLKMFVQNEKSNII